MAETHRAIRIVAQQEPMEVKLGPLSAIDLDDLGLAGGEMLQIWFMFALDGWPL